MKQEQLNNGWFAVEDKLPPFDERSYRFDNDCMQSVVVLMFEKSSREVYVGYYDYKDGWYLLTDADSQLVLDDTEITHWRFIPKLPNTEE